jgi:hypothetical protein
LLSKSGEIMQDYVIGLNSPIPPAVPNTPRAGMAQSMAPASRVANAGSQSIALEMQPKQPQTLTISGPGLGGQTAISIVRHNLASTPRSLPSVKTQLWRANQPNSAAALVLTRVGTMAGYQTTLQSAIPALVDFGARPEAARNLSPGIVSTSAALVRENARLVPFFVILILFALFGHLLPLGVREYISALFR